MSQRFPLVVTLSCALCVAAGCNITDYPVVFDKRGTDADGVVVSLYDQAFIIPSGQAVTVWDKGSDELYSTVTQDWTGDQWLYTYVNFDPTASIQFLDQTYCDSTRQNDCASTVARNPDLLPRYPFGYRAGSQGAGYDNADDIFDYILYEDCPGFRDISLLVSYSARLGECGSGLVADRQKAAAEFAVLGRTKQRARVLPRAGRFVGRRVPAPRRGRYQRADADLRPFQSLPRRLESTRRRSAPRQQGDQS